eukprot:2868388-Karenia_brevis.AAC.1
MESALDVVGIDGFGGLGLDGLDDDLCNIDPDSVLDVVGIDGLNGFGLDDDLCNMNPDCGLDV